MSQKETLGFQTEVKQLLHLMIHALYSNKEIFLRELISNASDAADKLRFAALSQPELLGTDPELKVCVDFDKEARTITISDNGIGMTRQEVIEHLGTIAKSGTREFLTKLTGDQAKDSHLIGQFGVGFYSAFIVADEVTVLTRKAGAAENEAVKWTSKAEGDYTIETVDKASRGTTIVLHLKADEDEFLDAWRLRHIITKYSDHITLPVMMKKTSYEEGKETVSDEYEAVNKATALWTLPKNEITPDDYKALYKHISHDFQDPLTWSHNRVEGKQEYTSLLYIPSHAPFDLYQRERSYGLKLYVKRVFIMDDAEQFLPNYLRFVKGVLDSNDLPLNISREILQSNRLVETMKGALTKRVLSMLEKIQQDEAENYAKFWNEFGRVLKEGIVEDAANQASIAKLLRFASTHTDTAEQTVTLIDYISRMKPGQEVIYFITAESFNAAQNSPQLEIFRQKGIEVLLMFDRIDEWLATHLTEFDGKKLQSVAKSSVDLSKIAAEDKKDETPANEAEFENLLTQVKTILGERVKDVRLSQRLTTSPACLVVDENDLNPHLQRILQQAGQFAPASKPILEVNAKHPILQRMQNETDDHRLTEWTNILFDQAVLAEGGVLDNPGQFVKTLNTLLVELAK